MSDEAWLNELKIAILNKDEKNAFDLISHLPNFSNIDDLICARELVAQVLQMLNESKNTLLDDMNKIRQIRLFLED